MLNDLAGPSLDPAAARDRAPIAFTGGGARLAPQQRGLPAPTPPNHRSMKTARTKGKLHHDPPLSICASRELLGRLAFGSVGVAAKVSIWEPRRCGKINRVVT